MVWPMSDLYVDLACSECGATETKTGQPFTERGLNLHRQAKHGIAARGPAEKAPKAPKPGGTRKAKLQSSLAMIGVGIALLDPVDGNIWADDVPTMAAALDAGAQQYPVIERLCSMIEDAGPISMIVQAFVRPLVRMAAHHRLVPEQLGRAFGPVPPPTERPRPDVQEPSGNGAAAPFAGITLTPEMMDQAQRLAEQFWGEHLTGQANVTIGQDAAPEPYAPPFDAG